MRDSRLGFDCAVLALVFVVPRIAVADEWWGRDKALHFTLSLGIAGGAYALSAPITEKREDRVAIGAGTSLLLGAANECHDAMGYGDPSWRDFAWDVAGTAAGVMIAYAVDTIVTGSPTRREGPSTVGNRLVFRF